MSEPVEQVVIVVAGGDAIDASALEHLPLDAYVIAADSGADHARAIGLTIDLLVGDLDSVAPSTIDELAADPSVAVARHPVDKDATDLALALDAARARAPDRIVLVGGHGGRLDHLLGNLLLLGGLAASAGARIEARMGAARVYVVSPGREVVIDASDGELVSLLAMHGDAAGIETDGLRWALHGETLAAGSTRGVSNELAGPTARISVRAGVLLVVQPGTR